MCVCVSVSEMAGEVLLASVLFLSATVSCFAVYSSGECFFNTKGEHIHTLNLIRKRISYTVYVHYIFFLCIGSGYNFCFNFVINFSKIPLINVSNRGNQFSYGDPILKFPGSCEHLGQVYEIGETWMTSDCFQCVCMEPFGVGCCDQ